jgi:two-component system cell cycle response regulator DivK
MPNDIDDTRILVVEDNLMNFVVIARMLGYIGIKTEWATTPDSAITRLKQDKYNLVIMDKVLPYMDGYQTLARVRSIPGLDGIKVLLCTVDSTEKEVDRANLAGFNGFIVKPLDTATFQDAIRYFLSGGIIPNSLKIMGARCGYSRREEGWYSYFSFE